MQFKKKHYSHGNTSKIPNESSENGGIQDYLKTYSRLYIIIIIRQNYKEILQMKTNNILGYF